jgi:lipopolysaccharide export system permease protein
VRAVVSAGGQREIHPVFAESVPGVTEAAETGIVMKILPRYLTTDFLKLFGICQFFFVVVYLVIDFLQKIDNFLEAETSAGAMVMFFVYKIPLVVLQMIPVAVMIAVIIMFSLMKKNNELTALKANGISVRQLSRPVIMCSIGVAVAAFLFSELVVPYATSKSEEIWVREVKRYGERELLTRYNVWYKGDRSIYWIGSFDGRQMRMHNVVLYFFDESFRPIKIIKAEKGEWVDPGWRIQNGFVQKAVSENEYSFEQFDTLTVDLNAQPDAFLRPVKEPEEMGYWELKRFASKIQNEGYDVTRYLVDLNIKLAFPAINILLVLIGIPIAVAVGRGGIPLAVTAGIGTCFLFLVVFGVVRSLGLSGVLPPLVSAWLSNCVFALLGVYLMMRTTT